MLAVIGGSGLSQLANLEVTQRKVVRTPYGEPSGPLTCGSIRGHALVFLARHGHGHTIAPHEVNYRANLWALKEQQVDEVVSIASVGGIRSDLRPGILVLPHQIIDYTWGRCSTFFEGADAAVTHVDFTEPYSAALCARIAAAAAACGEPVLQGGVYGATQGPRLETAAEIDRLEAALARELELEYAALSVVANYAAGRGDSAHGISLREIETVLERAMGRVRNIIEKLVVAAA